jgi:4'-phosphopantetheinyl transferase
MNRLAQLGLDVGCRIWLMPLDSRAASDESVLDSCERERARRLLGESRRARFVASRVALRTLLGQLLELPPAQVPLHVAANGKPHLSGSQRVMFSLSHSAPWAAIAVTQTAPIGVDLELGTERTDVKAIARRRFARAEAEAISALAPEPARASFGRCWTAKEAVVKALGLSLGANLRSVVVEADPGRALRLVAAPGELSASSWSLHELCVAGSRCHLTVAVAGPDVPVVAVDSLPELLARASAGPAGALVPAS